MNRFKTIPYILGVSLLVGSLMGAIQLNKGEGQPPGGAAPGKAPIGLPKGSEGLVAKGTVVPEFEMLSYGLPAHLPSGRVREILIRSNQVVKKGDVLARFDDWNLQSDLKLAEGKVQMAIRKQQEAAARQTQQKELIEKAKLALKDATESRDKSKEVLAALRKKLETQFRLEQRASTDQLLREDPQFLQAELLVNKAENAITEKTLDVKAVTAEPIEAKIEEASWAVETARADVEKVKQAIAQCEIKADYGGVIEKISATPGQVLYPQSRPMFFLIPEGGRLVRAEVVPEFASKIRNKDGSKVIISDDSNPMLTYEGTVEYTGTAFLPKANGVDLITGKPTNVLEVQIRVTDPAPPGKPPLLVGQPVRVTFP